MKIAVYYESCLGRNDGNPVYVTSFLTRTQHYCDVLLGLNKNDRLTGYFPLKDEKRQDDPLARETAKRIVDTTKSGIRVSHLRPCGDYKQFGDFDVNLWIDWGEDGLTGVLPYEVVKPNRGLMVYWASDTHLGYDYRHEFAKKCDIVFCAQLDAVNRFKKGGVDATWLPHAFEPLAYPRYKRATKPYDVCFVGHVNDDKRADFLDRMFREFPNFYYGQKRFEHASRKYSESKVVLNQSMRRDLNMRVFEVMGSGNLLLTDRIPDIDRLFEDGKHLVLYDNPDQAVEKAKVYLNHKRERELIAGNGHKEAMSKHTISHRVNAILDKVMGRLDAKNGRKGEALHAKHP